MNSAGDDDSTFPSSLAQQQRHALVICDVQTVAMNALPEQERRCLLDLLELLIQAVSAEQQPSEASNNIVKVLYSGLAFSKDYREIPRHHKLFGAFSRLYAKTGQVSIFVASKT
jgi:hypothetical protein